MNFQELPVSLLALPLPVLLLLPVPLALPLVTASSTELVWPVAPSWEPEALLSEPAPVVPSSLPLLEVTKSQIKLFFPHKSYCALKKSEDFRRW